MALASIPIPPDAKRDAKARDLVSQVKTWHRGTLNEQWGAFEAGTNYRITRNGHRCTAVFCSCQDYRSGYICKHIRAVVLWEAGLFSSAKYLKKYEDLVPAECDVRSCTDDAQPREPGDEGRYCKRHRLGEF